VVQGAAGPLQPEVAEEAVAGLWAAAAVVACGLHPVPRTTGRLGQGCRDDETAAVFHQRVAHEAELGFLAATLAIEQRLGMRARGMRGVAAIMRLSVFE
jgi:hypothetical protein